MACYARIRQYAADPSILPPSYSFYHWFLFRVLADVRDWLRREPRALGPDRGVYSIDPKGDLAARPDETADLRMDMETAMEKLTPLQRGVLQDYYVDGKSQVTIAKERGVSQVAVCKVLDRALTQLRSTLE